MAGKLMGLGGALVVGAGGGILAYSLIEGNAGNTFTHDLSEGIVAVAEGATPKEFSSMTITGDQRGLTFALGMANLLSGNKDTAPELVDRHQAAANYCGIALINDVLGQQSADTFKVAYDMEKISTDPKPSPEAIDAKFQEALVSCSADLSNALAAGKLATLQVPVDN